MQRRLPRPWMHVATMERRGERACTHCVFAHMTSQQASSCSHSSFVPQPSLSCSNRRRALWTIPPPPPASTPYSRTLRLSPPGHLATSVDNQPHVRPFSFAAKQDGKLWFCTATTKDVWQELLQNPLLEATAWWPGHGWLILRGRAGMDGCVSDEIREAGWKHLESLGEHYDGACDPHARLL